MKIYTAKGRYWSITAIVEIETEEALYRLIPSPGNVLYLEKHFSDQIERTSIGIKDLDAMLSRNREEGDDG